ncbi:MAG: hypothetical protein K2P88_07165 [Chitinophagaceae bacterium]|uniref:hypothetical protein n=1 Tax=unclassified Paraflavitalea TaxID=2798305 RepID=UPI003D33DE65|nr:hypothetical protein [Chitinophagaceae bacterium]
MNKFIFFWIVILNLVFTIQSSGQIAELNYLETNCWDTPQIKQEKSEIYYNRNYSDFFFVLLRDTCRVSNRITRYYFAIDTSYKKDNYFPSFHADSNCVKSIESLIRKNFTMLSSKFPDVFGHKYLEFKKYIRLYIGYTNENGNSVIAIQLVSVDEILKNRRYFEELNLLAQRDYDRLRLILVEHIAESYIISDWIRGRGVSIPIK